MSNTPLPEPVRTPLPEGALMGMLAIMDEYARAHAAAVTAERDARIKVLEDALRFYANPSDYKAPYTGGMGALYFDCGQTARAALGDKNG